MSLPSSTSLAFVLSLLLLSSLPSSTFADGHAQSKPIVTPITKDHTTSLFTIPIKNGAPMVLDLAGNLVWFTCKEFRMIHCKSSICKVANRNRQPSCGAASSTSDDPRCFCKAPAYNPVTGQCDDGPLAALPLAANATNGDHPLFPVSFSTYAPCAQEELLQSLPAGAAGVAGLSRLPLSLPSMVASRLKVPKQFALCLPSGGGQGQPGAAIFGGGPFVLQSARPEDLAMGLASLPLIKNPKKPAAYYFRVHGIAVNQEAVPLAPGTLDLDARTGKGGVVFSSVTPYTTLRSDVFNALISAFEKVTSGATRVKPPPPHNLCFDGSAFPSTRVGPGVANIDLMLDNGRNWTLPGASSLVDVGGRLCFAFQNMGSPASEAPDAPAIIFGTHQMQDNLVQFDLDKNTFGSSGLLLGRSTTCANFNFKTGSS